MVKDSTKIPYCPTCKGLTSLVNIQDIVEDATEYTISRFCTRDKCHYAWRTNRQPAPYRLAEKKLDNAANNAHEVARDLLCPMGVCQYLDKDMYTKAFSNILGYQRTPGRAIQVQIPVYHTWGFVIGHVAVTKKDVRHCYPERGRAAMLTHTYYPKTLYVTDNPIDALAIRYASARRSEAAAVLVLLPDRTVSLETLCAPGKICAVSSDPCMEQYLVENKLDYAILIDKSITQVLPDGRDEYLKFILDCGRH